MPRYVALAVDYDGTLARDSHVDEETVEAVRRVRASGRATILVTGRKLDELKRVFSAFDVFDRIVAENGAVLFTPAGGALRVLAPPYHPLLVGVLRRRGAPVDTGHAIIATWQPHQAIALDALRDLGLEYQIIFNKGAVMLLPSGHNKASGLAAALSELGCSYRNVVGIGDAENDHSFLARCEFAVAVQNALPSLRQEMDKVTSGDHGAGVREVADELISHDLRTWDRSVTRHDFTVGHDAAGRPVTVPAHGEVILVTGASQSGKSTFAAGLLCLITEGGYQACVVDPEGDYEDSRIGQQVVLGDAPPPPHLVRDLLRLGDDCLTVNLLQMPLELRPAVLGLVLDELLELRRQLGRPHWILIDEAHHMLWRPLLPRIGDLLQRPLDNIVLVTVHPSHLAPEALERVTTLIVAGSDPTTAVAEFCESAGLETPRLGCGLGRDEILVWKPGRGEPRRVRTMLLDRPHRRHRRKYAEGNLGTERSFYFRGPRAEMNVPAANLAEFVRLSRTLDEASWSYHLERGDFTRWFRECVRDDVLADRADALSRNRRLSAAQARRSLETLIHDRYAPPP